MDAAPRLLAALREASGDTITAFEYLQRSCIEVLDTYTDLKDPLDEPYEHYALVELSSSHPEAALGPLLEQALGAAFEEGIAVNAVIAASGAQADQLWRMRETLPEAQKNLGVGIKHDVSVPVSRVPDFVRRAVDYCEAAIPGVRVLAFGHVGGREIGGPQAIDARIDVHPVARRPFARARPALMAPALLQPHQKAGPAFGIDRMHHADRVSARDKTIGVFVQDPRAAGRPGRGAALKKSDPHRTSYASFRAGDP